MASSDLFSALSRSSDSVLSGPFASGLRDGTATHAQVAEFLSQYVFLSNAFPLLLCNYCARLSDDSLRMGVIENLWDEHGRGDVHTSHRTLLETAVARYTMRWPSRTNYQTWQTQLLINGFHGITNNGSISVALGAMLFCESITPSEFVRVLHWLETNTDLEEDALKFWKSHIEHDGDHTRALVDQFSRSDMFVESEVIDGIQQSALLEDIFWRQFAF